MTNQRQGKILSLLRRFQGSSFDDMLSYLRTEHRQNLKTLEYWNQDSVQAFTVCEFDVGASGLANLNTLNSPQIRSITRSTAGRYDIGLRIPFVQVDFFEVAFSLSTGSPASMNVVLRSIDTVNGVIVVEFLNGSFTATDIAIGTNVKLKLFLKTN